VDLHSSPTLNEQNEYFSWILKYLDQLQGAILHYFYGNDQLKSAVNGIKILEKY